MNVVDIAIILILLLGAVIGFKRGLTRQLVSAVGFFIIIILSFLLKNPISVFLYEHLPFFKFGGVLKGVTVLNIALYELVAFLVVLSILMIIFQILKSVTSIFEHILKMTIILGIPSKILGAVVGVIENYVWIFIILYIASLPLFNLNIIKESKYKDIILNNTPVLSNVAGNSLDVITEFANIKTKYESDTNATEFNKETLDLFLKYDVITVKSVDKLVDLGKLKIDNIESVLSKYREGQ